MLLVIELFMNSTMDKEEEEKRLGEPDDAKVSRPVRKGAFGKGHLCTSLEAYLTLHVTIGFPDTETGRVDGLSDIDWSNVGIDFFVRLG